MTTRVRPRVLTVSDGGRSAMVMVGPVRGPAHRNVIHQFNYYHVPVSAIAASRAAVAFIAFYEGAAQFHTETGAIREYAVVLRFSRVLRRDLPGLSWAGRSGEDATYYRFDLGPIRMLPHPIPNPDGLRVLFRYVDLTDLEHAESIRMLRKAPSLLPHSASLARRKTARGVSGSKAPVH